MSKKELLSPVGSVEAFYAAINAGADALYLGLDKYSARAYTTTFNLDNIKQYIDYAHLRNVKIYITINTVVFDDELADVYNTIDVLASYSVDAIIVQDLAIFHYITNKYKSTVVHASTQMGIDDIYGAKFIKDMGATRVVLARETTINEINNIKKKLDIELEAFIHGALCVCYSGDCLMSSMIGDRSGNRGRCAGPCRQQYTLINTDLSTSCGNGFLLSMKDLNTSKSFMDLSKIDSYKIEGRMKPAHYVGLVTNVYRKIIDNQKVDINSLEKVFNREFTKGYILNADKAEITNITKPNNTGYEIGFITRLDNKKIWIKLKSELSKGDQISINLPNKFKEISLPITKMFDSNFDIKDTINNVAIIYTDTSELKVGYKVYKTKDSRLINEIETAINSKPYRKSKIDIHFDMKIGKKAFLKVQYGNFVTYQKSISIVQPAISHAVSKDNIIKQLEKLNDTPYEINKFDINIDENCFINLKEINEMRRNAIEDLNKQRLNFIVKYNHENKDIVVHNVQPHKPEIVVQVNNQRQYNKVKELGINNIYFDNILLRNNTQYLENKDLLLVGGYNAINYYQNKNVKLVADTSFNVTNHVAAGILSSLGIDRITLSLELDKNSINNLVQTYIDKYKTYPNFEVVIYGRTSLMHMKYCPLKRLNMCGQCKQYHFALKDKFESFPLQFNKDCTANLLNAKILNNIDLIENLQGIYYFRVIFSDESDEEIEFIINNLKAKLNGENTRTFNKLKHTHGHFFNRPL